MASAAGMKKLARGRTKLKAMGFTLSDLPEVETIDSTFPISAAEQGSFITTFNIGTGSNLQTFKIHKNLFFKASKCFNGALNDGFLESITFPSKDKLTKTFWYTKFPVKHISPALLWLRVYKFADCRLIGPLQKAAYRKVCSCFEISTLGFLTSQLIDELHDDTGSEDLQHYLVHHATYHMGRPMTAGIDQGNWKVILLQNSEFKAATGAKVIEAHLPGQFGHPSALEEF